MAEKPTYYRLLDLGPRQSAPLLSTREVKQAYHRALLQHHPDKTTSPSSKASPITVDDLAQAFKTLSDPQLRGEYDRWLHSADAASGAPFRSLLTGLETVDLDDLLYDPESEIWSRGCRCGEQKGFVVSGTELEKNAEQGEIVVGCKGCSLWLRVLYGLEE